MLSDCVLTPPELAAKLPRGARIVVGEGAQEGAAALVALRPDLACLVLPALGASAASVARLGAALLAQGAARDAAELVPTYLRRAEAEARRTGERLRVTLWGQTPKGQGAPRVGCVRLRRQRPRISVGSPFPKQNRAFAA